MDQVVVRVSEVLGAVQAGNTSLGGIMRALGIPPGPATTQQVRQLLLALADAGYLMLLLTGWHTIPEA